MLFLGSRRGRNIGQGPQRALKDEYNVTSIFKPNADLNNITGNIANLCKYFTKEYHITIIGGPRKNNYEIEKRISDIGNCVHFVGHFSRNDKLCFGRYGHHRTVSKNKRKIFIVQCI